jgi:hypothetical protein
MEGIREFLTDRPKARIRERFVKGGIVEPANLNQQT